MTSDDEKDEIKNNYSFLELEDQIKGMKGLEKIYKLASFFGFENKKISKELNKIEDLEGEFDNLRTLPDRFNNHFAEKGWIAYESLNIEIMEEAVFLADDGKFEEAEKVLIDYYDEKNIKFMFSQLKGIEEFHPRMDLLYKAFDDYIEGRYHACIPVILMMIDGFVNDIKQKGFFAEGVDLEVWDTIAAHDSGLNVLTDIFGKSRKKTVSDEITVPYRNGIMHGRDLGYDNKVVAAKTWGALFAISDWARAIKNENGEEKEEYESPTLSEAIELMKEGLEKHKKVKKEKQLIKEWEPREIKISEDIPANGDLFKYKDNTSEKVLVRFLEYWIDRNYGNIAKLITKATPTEETIGKIAGDMRKIFEDKELIDFEIINIKDEAPAITEIKVKLTLKYKDQKKIVNYPFRLVYEGEDCKSLVRSSDRGSWKVVLNFCGPEFI
jgi:hypothetical protein